MRAVTLTFLQEYRHARIDVIADRLVATIESDNPGYRLPVVPSADLRRSCLDNVGRVLELLTEAVRDGGVPPRFDGAEAYDAAQATGLRRAEQGMPLDDVLRSFRIGGRLIWEDLVEHGESALDAHELRDIGSRLWEVVDETSAQVATAYHSRERALVRADEQQRAELWEGVLGGRAREPGFAHDASLLLDVPVRADFVVVLGRGLDPRATDQLLSPHATAWTHRAEGAVGLVALREDVPDEALAALSAAAAAAGVAAGVSAVVRGLARVDEGHRQAALALRAQGGTAGLAAFEERLPEVLLLGSPDVAALLLGRWVDPILALPAQEGRALLVTLEAWVSSAGSATRTAEAVHCHRNTVVNRLHRVAALTGVTLVDDRPPVELDLALRARRMRLRSDLSVS